MIYLLRIVSAAALIDKQFGVYFVRVVFRKNKLIFLGYLTVGRSLNYRVLRVFTTYLSTVGGIYFKIFVINCLTKFKLLICIDL